MKSKAEKAAIALHEKDYNCTQSVLTACGEFTGLDDSAAFAIAAGFGRGVCNGEICGAISGAVMAVGLAYAGADPTDKDAKKKVYSLTRKCTNAAKRRYGCIRCAELKAKEVSCKEMIGFMAKTAEKILIENDKENQ